MSGMKDSGVEWIGEIPEGWGTVKLGPRLYMKGRIGWQGLRFDDFVDEGPYLVTGTDFCNGRVDWSRCYHIDGEKYAQDPAIHLRSGDLLFTKDGTVGKLAYINELPGPASLNSHLLVLRPQDEGVNNRYLFWLLQSPVFDRYKLLVQHGSVMDSISQADMAHFIIPAPGVSEQAAIADYLDASVGENDSAIRAVEAQVSTLERYRASVIHEAVTRGLDPTAPTKPSGVDWIGDIPQGWESRPLGCLGTFQNGISKDGASFGSGYPFVSYGDAYNNRVLPVIPSGLVQSTPEERYRYSVRFGDILFTRTSETIDEIAYASTCLETIENATFAGFLIRFRPSGEQLDPRFGSFYFRSSHLRKYFSREMVIVTRASLGQQLLKRLPVLIPPLTEQAAIADYLDARTAAIDAVIVTKRQQLDVLKRQRQSLIYEYVTGKRRVAQEG